MTTAPSPSSSREVKGTGDERERATLHSLQAMQKQRAPLDQLDALAAALAAAGDYVFSNSELERIFLINFDFLLTFF